MRAPLPLGIRAPCVLQGRGWRQGCAKRLALCMQPGPTRRGVEGGHRRGARQAFVDILATNETFAAPMDATYSLLGLSPKDVTTLEQYLQARSRSRPPLTPQCSPSMQLLRARSPLLPARVCSCPSLFSDRIIIVMYAVPAYSR